MEMKAIIKSMIRQYPVIYFCTMVATIIYCGIFVPDENFPLTFLISLFVFGLLGDLPMLLFYSPKELTEKQWRVRKVLHFITLELVLLFTAKCLDFYQTLLQGVFFFILILFVYITVCLSVYYSDKRLANTLNEEIMKRKRS